MVDKQWYVVFTKGPVGVVYRYAIQYELIPGDGFKDDKEYRKWYADICTYFHERTGITEKILTVELADFLSAYSYRN